MKAQYTKPDREAVTVSGWGSGRKIKEQLIFIKSGVFAKLALISFSVGDDPAKRFCDGAGIGLIIQ